MSSVKSDHGRMKETVVDSRINKVLAMRTDSVAMLEALDAISEFYVSSKILFNSCFGDSCNRS